MSSHSIMTALMPLRLRSRNQRRHQTAHSLPSGLMDHGRLAAAGEYVSAERAPAIFSNRGWALQSAYAYVFKYP